MATKTNQKNKQEDYEVVPLGSVCINIDKLRNTVGYAASLKTKYREACRVPRVLLPTTCVLVTYPSGRKTVSWGPIPLAPEQFDEFVDGFAKVFEDLTDDDWCVLEAFDKESAE